MATAENGFAHLPTALLSVVGRLHEANAPCFDVEVADEQYIIH